MLNYLFDNLLVGKRCATHYAYMLYPYGVPQPYGITMSGTKMYHARPISSVSLRRGASHLDRLIDRPNIHTDWHDTLMQCMDALRKTGFHGCVVNGDCSDA